MNELEHWHARVLGEAACAALAKNGFDARYAGTGAEALAIVETFVKPGLTVGFGGSMTLQALGVRQRAAELGARVLDHSDRSLTAEQKMEVMRAQLTADLFLSGANAITLAGEICNVDGNGNRVAALAFGPRKTVVVAGFNKIVRNLEEAQERLETVACPLNNRRLGIKNPCTVTGLCADCAADSRICRVYSVLRRRPSKSDFTVIIVGEQLGF